ncbi:hypothetical protein Tco_1245641 [Tanacetum coccineum]
MTSLRRISNVDWRIGSGFLRKALLPDLPLWKRYQGTSELVEDDDEEDKEIEGNDESHGLDDEGHSVESDRLGLGEEEEVVPEGQQRAVLVVGSTCFEAPLGLAYGELRRLRV